uniref:Uncharacterized protein n=1 Tax=Sphingobacterium sp. (strain 21) TaxID=743722 RepID=F4CBL8_SPHS2
MIKSPSVLVEKTGGLLIPGFFIKSKKKYNRINKDYRKIFKMIVFLS